MSRSYYIWAEDTTGGHFDLTIFVGKFRVLGQSFVKLAESISGVIQPSLGVSNSVTILPNTRGFQETFANIWYSGHSSKYSCSQNDRAELG